ncbi:MAG: hypothetical protein NVSMB46_02650 [Candidatus Saccharimonadales bacterium]
MTYVSAMVICKDSEQAQLIAKTLLGKCLVASARCVPVSTALYVCNNDIKNTSEVILYCETHESRCSKIEEELERLYGSDTYAFTATPLIYVSKKTRVWLSESLKLLGL